jgi:uncharacterized protein
VTELLISSDSHANISHETIKSYLASKFHAEYNEAAAAATANLQAFRRPTDDPNLKSARQVSESKDEFETAVRRKHWNRPGHEDPIARLADMDADGVAKEVIYCEVSGFRYLYMLKHGSREATMAFNNAMHEFGAADPSRLVVSYQVPINNIDFAIEEVQRVASLGGKSLQLPVHPIELDLPDYYHERYDPLFAAISESGLPICCHIGVNTDLQGLSSRDPTPGGLVLFPMVCLSTAASLGMWIMGGVFERFPALKLVLVEPGVTWLSWWLYSVDDMIERQHYVAPGMKKLPSEYFHRNVFVTLIDEPDVKSSMVRSRIGVENIMWSSDYPHAVTTWPNSHKFVNEMFADIPSHERELMVSGNAKRVWSL